MSAVSVSRARPFRVRKVGAYLLLAVVAILVAFPLLIALSYSLMSESDIVTFPPPLFPAHPSLDNFGKVLSTIPVLRTLPQRSILTYAESLVSVCTRVYS